MTAPSRSVGVATALLTVVIGIGCEPPPDGAIGVVSEEVTNGSLVTSNTAPFNSVVAIPSNGCTGTKIGTRRFLSAAHCFIGTNAGDSITISNQLDGSSATTFTIAQIDRHPSFDAIVSEGGGTIPATPRVFEATVVVIDADTPSIPSLPLRTGFVSPGLSATVVGYGCDGQNPGNGGRKQKGTLNVISNSDPDITAHFWGSSGPATICPGDSGGPDLIRNPNRNNRWEIAGINVGFGPGTNSALSRIGSVLRWIQSPAKNVFSDSQRGSFMNGQSLYCMGIEGASTSSGKKAKQFYCDVRNQPTDHEFWQLTDLGFGFFRITNRKSGKCLAVSGDSLDPGALVIQKTCDTTSPPNTISQVWRFIQNTANFYLMYNAHSGHCITVSSGDGGGNGTDLIQSACAVSGVLDRQSWLFTR
jgi:V8-like Glu-specific endopeptidase